VCALRGARGRIMLYLCKMNNREKPRIPPNQWVQPIAEFTATRQNLPHLQLRGSWYASESNTWNGLVLTEEQRDKVFHAIHYRAGTKYDLEAAVVMPTHVHLIIHPLPKSEKGYYSLPEIFHSIKSYTANYYKMQLWQDENYDHIIRNEKDFFEKLYYLINNPVEAGLVARPEDYRWLFYKGMPPK